MKKLNYAVLASLVFTVGCAKKLKDDELVSVSANEAEVESGITAVSSILDEGAGINYGFNTKPKNLMDLIVPKAYAADCHRAFESVCSNQIREASYNECAIGAIKMSGSVQLAYSESNCTMLNDGSTMTRTYDLQRVGPRGGTLSTTSTSKQDYRSNVLAYGGGGRLTQLTGGHSVEILGKHKTLTIRGREVYNVSIRTLAALQVTGGLGRADRTIVSGQLEVNHNLAERTAVWTFNNVQYSSLCVHPISGTIDITWSGKKTGQAQLTFSGCSVAQIVEGGQSTQVELSYSE